MCVYICVCVGMCIYKDIRVCVCICLFSATPVAYRSSQARGQISTVAAGLCYSHGNARSESCQ